jgi:WXG100 family type VII secretion target
MPDGYTGTVQDFTDAQQKVSGVNEDVQATIKQVADTVMGLQGAWTGAAATAFQNMMLRFNDDATKLNQALLAISEQLGQAGGTYQAQEDAKLDTFGGLSGRLEG